MQLMDLFMPLAVALVVLVLGYGRMRLIAGGPLLPSDKTMLVYGFWFVLGMGYLMVAAAKLQLSKAAMFSLIGAWGVLLFLIWRKRSRATRSALEAPRTPIATQLAEGLPPLALLVCLVGAGIQGEYILRGEGRLWVGLLWLVGIAGSIWLARRNRKEAVVLALRVCLAFLVIGAIAQQSLGGVVAAGVIGGVLFLIGKYWHSGADGEQRGEEASSSLRDANAPPTDTTPRHN